MEWTEVSSFINSFSDEKGGISRHPLSPTWPAEMRSTITFLEQDGGTKLVLEGIPVNASEEEARTLMSAFDSMHQGFGGTLDQLADYLATI